MFVGRHNTVKMAMLQKVTCRSDAIPNKIPIPFFTLGKKNPKVHMETQEAQNNQSHPKQKEQGWTHRKTAFQIILQSHRNQTAWNCHKNRPVKQNKHGNKPHCYGHLILNKEAKNMH